MHFGTSAEKEETVGGRISDVKQIIETLFDTYDTDDSKFLEENEVRQLLKDLYSDMGQGEPDK